MALGTLDRTPPPFFKQGPSAFTRLMFFSSLAVFLMVADVRFQVTQPLRSLLATVLHPVQQVLLAPVALWEDAGRYLTGLEASQRARNTAERLLAAQAERVMRVNQLEIENARLRELLDLRPRVNVKSLSAEVLYDAPDPYTRKVVVDRGSKHGAVLGAPVIDDKGVLGQVTRLYPLTSEVTLVTDRDAAVPVINARTLQRGVAYGLPQAAGMELRFMAGNADVQAGDVLNTSGLDGIYPPGLPVATVVRVDRRAESAFARIQLAPLARPDNPRHVLLLHPLSEQLPSPPPELAASAAERASMASQPASAVSSVHGGALQ
ncbi:MAG TPA: rod shape-determining protein MreC [Aquabacterium sp.]|nr:rod shape-determining protein MreC [Aquabacterium sp.]